ncbi:hypothetical protein EV363DRAFT_1446775 [Boletus edulis]|nr:hypothetical protein EV363DRAFT_1446775 [Boletus edulis]
MFKLALACIRHRPVHVSVRTFSVPLHTRPALRRASFFPWSSTVSPPPPSLDTAAEIAALEARANAHPDDVQKQLAFFNALIVTRTKEGYDTVIDRWEHTSERNPSSPLLHSDDAFKVYLDALASSDREPSIDNAVRKRQSLLDSLPPFPPSSDTSPSSPPEPPPTPPPQSRSEKIAAELLARRANPTSQDPSPLNPAIADLAAALSKGGGVSGNPIHVTLSEPKGSFTMRIVRFVVLAGLSGFFILVILSVLLENSGLLKTGGRATEFEPLQQKPVKFDDVHGIDEELADVITFLKDPTAFASLGGKLPKGILLTGPPGTGKTMLARAIAGEAGVPFFFSSGSEFEEMFVGVGAKRVRDLFAAARKKQPAIIFIDELDAVGGKRSQRDQHYMKQTLNQLLVEMDGFLQTEGVIVIAATNFPQSLDPALTRPGRFDRHIAVPLPDVRGRLQLLSHFMKDVIASNAVDPMILARGTPWVLRCRVAEHGQVGSYPRSLGNDHSPHRLAWPLSRQQRKVARKVILKHFEWAKDRIVMGAERKSAYIDEKNKLLTAYHEGGHALAALYTEGAMPLHKVTCVPRGHALGVTSQLPEGDMFSISQSEYKAMIDFTVKVVLTSGCSSDLQKATHTATQMVKVRVFACRTVADDEDLAQNFGFSDKVGPVYYSDQNGPVSPQASERIDSAILTLLQQGERRVTTLLEEKQEELHRLARALVEHETLTADEVRKVIKGERIRDLDDKLN